MGDVVALEDTATAEAHLRDRVAALEHRISRLAAVLRLALALVKVSGFRLELARLPEDGRMRIILGAVERARKVMPLSAALRVLRLSAAQLPHAALGVRGSDAGRDVLRHGENVPDELAVRRLEARRRRLERNQAIACAVCPRLGEDEAA